MKRKNILLLFLISFTVCANCLAQQQAEKKSRITQERYPKGLDNSSFMLYYFAEDGIYNNRGVRLFDDDIVDDIRLNPSNTSLASLHHTKKGIYGVSIFDVNPTHRLLSYPSKKIKMKEANTTAIAYSADARQLAISSSNRVITVFNPITNKEVNSYTSALVPQRMAYSDNNFFLGALEGKKLEIWNLERGAVRKTLEMAADINDFCFSKGSSQLYVLTKDGNLTVYDTKTFDSLYTISDLGQAIACYPNDDGKYVAVVYNDQHIFIINLLDPNERHQMKEDSGKVSHIRLVRSDYDHQLYMIYNAADAIVFHRIDGLSPYYNKMMTSMLNEQLNQWMKQQPGESMEDYNLRVNETSRAAQAKLLETEIATKMATGLLEESEVAIGDYNMNTKSLTLKINSMPDIFIGVPMDELNAFSSTDNLEFRNAKYALNPDDKFELVYVEVYNPANGKTYIFDNMERRSLSYMSEGDNFVPLEIIQTSNMEETTLLDIKENIVNLAQQENVISDKTHISVKTEAFNAVNADGEKIVNYNVGFTYEVEEEFSARDDFKPGHYHTQESAAAMLMLKIMQKAFEGEFSKYIVKGKRVKIQVKGTADASPIARALRYDGRYGEYEGEPVYKNNELNNITLNKKEGIADNEQLAFARAIGVQNFIEKEISAFADMVRDYEYHIEVAKEAGSQFRRISVQYTFIDAF